MSENNVIDSSTVFNDDVEQLKKQCETLNQELLFWRDYSYKITRLVRVFRNDYAIMQTKCCESFEKEMGDGENKDNYNDFLRGKLHTVSEIINDLNVILSIKLEDRGTDYSVGVEEEKN
jgi:hypothetical protein